MSRAPPTPAPVRRAFVRLAPVGLAPIAGHSCDSALLTPYPQYGTLNQWFTPGAGDHYNSLQISARRAYSAGLTLMFGFNYNTENAQGYYNDIATFAQNVTWIPAQTGGWVDEGG